MHLEIKVYPDSILRKKARPVKRIGKEEQRLACDMIETMRSANGLGLAAPQVGISKRIIIAGDIENKSSAIALINPVVVKKRGVSHFCEGCLSLPGLTSDVVRPDWVIVEGLNLEGEKLRIETAGLLARVLQHEIDHLNGVLFIDRIGLLRRKRLIRQLSSKL